MSFTMSISMFINSEYFDRNHSSTVWAITCSFGRLSAAMATYVIEIFPYPLLVVGILCLIASIISQFLKKPLNY
jgi:hypothetical protein